MRTPINHRHGHQRRTAAIVLVILLACAATACTDGGPDGDQRPQLPAPVPTGARDFVPAATESSSSLFVLQRPNSGSASGYAASESNQFILTREELPQ